MRSGSLLVTVLRLLQEELETIHLCLQIFNVFVFCFNVHVHTLYNCLPRVLKFLFSLHQLVILFKSMLRYLDVTFTLFDLVVVLGSEVLELNFNESKTFVSLHRLFN